MSKYHYGLRLDGKRYSVTESGPATNGATTNYTYDDQGKLTQEAGPYATIAYTYDAVGNRLTRTVTNAATGNGTTLVNGATATSYDVNDRIATVNGGVTHTYDADGNETTVNGQAAGYDFENHLVSVASIANGTVLASYVYDADGNRVSTYVSNNPTTTSYVVDTSLPYASVVEEYSGTATVPSARYDYGDDLVRMDRGSGVYYYIYDGLGSTRQLVNPAGAVTDSYGYSAFGELASHTGTTSNPFLFNAQQFDQASGGYYLRARYYDQSNGRFVSQDPLSGSNDDPITLHRYLYTSNEPTDRIDPSGMGDETLSGVQAGLCVVGTLSGIGAGYIYGTHGGNIADAAVYGTEISSSLIYSACESPVEFGETVISAILGGSLSIALDEGSEAIKVGGFNKLIDRFGDKDFTDKLLRDFIQGAATGAVAGAFGSNTEKSTLAFVTGGDTFINDAVGIFDDYERGEITTKKQFGYKVAGLAFDTVFSAGIAYALDNKFFKGPIQQDEQRIIIKYLQSLNGQEKKLFKTAFEGSIASLAGILVGQGPKRATDRGAESP